MIEKMKWKVECQAKVRNSMSCATQCPTTLSLEYLAKIMKGAIRRVTIIILPIMDHNTVADFEWSYKSEGNKEEFRSL